MYKTGSKGKTLKGECILRKECVFLPTNISRKLCCGRFSYLGGEGNDVY